MEGDGGTNREKRAPQDTEGLVGRQIGRMGDGDGGTGGETNRQKERRRDWWGDGAAEGEMEG
jgi:hypothetical protein